jgi:hypothetical protein
VGAQPPEPRSTGLGNTAPETRLLAAPNRYLAGSTAASCLLERADDGTAVGKDYPDQVANARAAVWDQGRGLRERSRLTHEHE